MARSMRIDIGGIMIERAKDGERTAKTEKM